MDINRLSNKLNESLNDQITKEANAAQIYLSYGAWADSEGYAGTAKFLFKHSLEERNHMMKVLKYVLERGGKPKIAGLGPTPQNPKTLQECFENVLKHEIDNTNAIYKIASLAMEEKDYATWNFAQWFVKEQIEEETLAMDLLSKLKIAGGSKATDEALLYFDDKMDSQPDEVDLARTATTSNP